MALKEKILSTVTTIVLVGLEMESPVDFDGDAARDRQKVDFHLRVRSEWNVKFAVEREEPFCARQSVKVSVQKPLGRTPRPVTLGLRCRDKQVGGLRVQSVPSQTSNGLGERLVLS